MIDDKLYCETHAKRLAQPPDANMVAQAVYRYGNRQQTQEREREREMFYLMTHSTHFIYGYMVSDIW